jgi:hypothetical protein
MDRDVLDGVEREIDQEVRARFRGSAVRQAVLLQYGDDPEVEPVDLWVRVPLDAERPDDFEQTLAAFGQPLLSAVLGCGRLACGARALLEIAEAEVEVGPE